MRTWVSLGALSAALAVLCGAFGAHALKEILSAQDLEVWRTAVLYHAVHALALVLFGLFQGRQQTSSLPGVLFLAGTVLFAGSLYGLGLGGPRWWGAVTPFGGVALVVGWVAFAIQALRTGNGTDGPRES